MRKTFRRMCNALYCYILFNCFRRKVRYWTRTRAYRDMNNLLNQKP